MGTCAYADKGNGAVADANDLLWLVLLCRFWCVSCPVQPPTPWRPTMRPVRTLAALTAAAALFLTSAPASASTAPQRPAQAAAKTYQGEGDDVIRINATKVRGIVTLTHDGESNFIVETLNSKGRQQELLANEIGPWSGTVVYNAQPGTSTAIVKVKADGAWTLKFDSITRAPLWKFLKVTNTGTKVLRLKSPTRGVRTMRAVHSGESNFIVYAYTSSRWPELLVNEIGDYSGKVVLPAGTRYVSVMADGKWSLKRS